MVTQRIELEPEPGHRLIGDSLVGDVPGYVYMHGLTSVREGEKSEALLEHARSRGRGFMRFDFRGHGDSTGKVGVVTVSELIEDGLTMLRHQGRSIVVGSSMGGLVAAWLGALHEDLVAGLVLLSPALGFLSRMASRTAGSDTLRNGEGREIALHPRVLEDAALYDEKLLPGRLTMPVLVVHGTDDEVVPAKYGKALYDGIRHDQKRLWLVPGGDHRLNQPIEQVYAIMDELMDRAQ